MVLSRAWAATEVSGPVDGREDDVGVERSQGGGRDSIRGQQPSFCVHRRFKERDLNLVSLADSNRGLLVNVGWEVCVNVERLEGGDHVRGCQGKEISIDASAQATQVVRQIWRWSGKDVGVRHEETYSTADGPYPDQGGKGGKGGGLAVQSRGRNTKEGYSGHWGGPKGLEELMSNVAGAIDSIL